MRHLLMHIVNLFLIKINHIRFYDISRHFLLVTAYLERFAAHHRRNNTIHKILCIDILFFILVQNRFVETALFPYIVFLQVTPIVAIAPLIIIWVKDATLSLVVCATLMAVFPIISNTTQGLRSVSPGLLSYFRLNHASRWQTLVRLRIPSALPYFFGALRISSGLSLIGAVVAEFVAGTGGTNTGLAYQILQAGYQLDIPLMFAALLLISLAGIALFGVMSWVSRRALSAWHESEAVQSH